MTTVQQSFGVVDAYDGEPRTLTVEHEPAGLSVHAPGFGTSDMIPGAGPVVLVEYREGVPFVVVWADVTTEEPTHQISLAGAAESHRLPD